MPTPPKMPPKSPARAKGIPAPPPKERQQPRKTFSVGPWTGHGEGEKVVIYGTSGMGKTTLASMMPGAILIGLDDGGRKIRDPRTGNPIQHVEGIETFQDVRDALAQPGLWPSGSTCVIDTVTVLESLAEPWMFEHIPHEKGQRVSSLEGYGYGKGYTHLYDTIRCVLQDLDGLIRKGVNVCLICQAMAVKKANVAGADYLYDGPKLSHPSTEKNSVRLHVCEWADHVFKIDYLDVSVSADGKKLGKATGGEQRAVFTQPAAHFFAKTRSLQEPVVSFAEAKDDSIWRFLWPED